MTTIEIDGEIYDRDQPLPWETDEQGSARIARERQAIEIQAIAAESKKRAERDAAAKAAGTYDYPWNKPGTAALRLREAAEKEAAREASQAEWIARKVARAAAAEGKRAPAPQESPVVEDSYNPSAYRGEEPSQDAGRFWFALQGAEWVDEFGQRWSTPRPKGAQ